MVLEHEDLPFNDHPWGEFGVRILNLMIWLVLLSSNKYRKVIT